MSTAREQVIKTLNQFPWEKEEEADEFADYVIETTRSLEFDTQAVLDHCEKEWDDLDADLKTFMAQAINENILPNKQELYPDLAPTPATGGKKAGAKKKATPAAKKDTPASKPAPKKIKAPAKKPADKSKEEEPAPEPESKPDTTPENTKTDDNSPTKKRRGKKPRPHTDYHMFCEEHRPIVRKKYEGTEQHAQVEKDLGAMWSEADEDTKAKYAELAKKYNDEHGFVRKSEQPKSESERKQMGPYSMFFKEMRPKVAEECPEMDSTEIMKEVGRRWATLKSENPNTNAEWQAKADEYNQEHGRKAKGEKEPKPVDKTGVPTNPYLMFQEEFRQNFLEKNPDANPDLVKAELKKAYAATSKDKTKYAHYKLLAEEENIRRGVKKPVEA